MYKIFKRGQNTLSLIEQQMKIYIDSRCEAVVNEKKLHADPIAFVQSILESKNEMDLMIMDTFEGNRNF